MKLINLTPHLITVVIKREAITEEHQFVASGRIARVATVREVIETVDSGGYLIPVTRVRFAAVEGLPETVPGVGYIVSSIVAQAVPERTDVFVPDDLIRDTEGRVVGCRSLARVGA